MGVLGTAMTWMNGSNLFEQEAQDAALRGRPSWDVMLMFRVLLLGVNYQLSDPVAGPPFSFKRFVGLRNDCDVPDQKTIWKYRHRLAASGRTAWVSAHERSVRKTPHGNESGASPPISRDAQPRKHLNAYRLASGPTPLPVNASPETIAETVLTLISHNGWLGCDVCACKFVDTTKLVGLCRGEGDGSGVRSDGWVRWMAKGVHSGRMEAGCVRC